jgi:hypothetical protein
VEVRQRAVLHDVEVMTASSVSRYLECIAISAPPPALSRRECGHHPACSASRRSRARIGITS